MVGAENRVVERDGVLTHPSGDPDKQAHPVVNMNFHAGEYGRERVAAPYVV